MDWTMKRWPVACGRTSWGGKWSESQSLRGLRSVCSVSEDREGRLPKFGWEGRTNKNKAGAKSSTEQEGVALGLSLQRLECVPLCTCWANPVLPEDAHGLWGEPV